jgi:tape measure domain-containing protein
MANIDERVVKLSMDDSSLQQGVSRVTKALEQLKKAFNFSDTKSFEELDKAAKKVKFDSVSKSASDMQKDVSKATSKAADDFAEMGSSAQKSVQQIGAASDNVNLTGVASAANKMSDQVQRSAAEANSAIGKIGTNTVGIQQTVDAIDGINDAANRVDLSPIQKGVENVKMGISSMRDSLTNSVNAFKATPIGEQLDAVQPHFKALEAIGVVAMGNLAAKAATYGMQLASNMTNGIRSGFEEYETQLNSVQTILANTQKEGTNLTQVNTALNQLNTYADKTIYNFTEMTRNIGTFTAAGVDLQTSVNSIKGIANLAAISGSSSAQASTAMYQLSQALATGTVKLMDWNSVVNAGMGGQVFQDLLVQTSEKLGTGAKQYIAAEGSFRDSLQKGWLTSDVLTQSLNILAMDITDVEKAVQSLVSKGYTEEEARQLVQLAQTAQDAATEVKTFSQLIDTAKEAVGSGWSQSMQIIFGDFEEAKDLWTGVSDEINNIINAQSQARNQLLSSGFSSGYKQLVNQGIVDTQSFQDILTNLGGKDYVSGLIKQYGSFEKSLHAGWLTAGMLKDGVAQLTQKVDGYDDATKQNLGITNEQINQLHALNAGLQNGSISADEFANKMQRMSGRENVIQGLANVWNSLKTIIQTVGKAWDEVMPSMSGDTIYAATEAFRKFTEGLKPSPQLLNVITTATKGVATAFKAFLGIVGLAAKGFGTLLGFAGKVAGSFINIASSAINGAKAFAEYVKQSKVVTNAVKLWEASFSSFGTVLKTIGDSISGVFDGMFDGAKKGTSGFPDILGIISKTLAGCAQEVNNYGTEFQTAFQAKFGSVPEIAQKVSDKVSSAIQSLRPAFDWIGDRLQEIGDAIQRFFGDLNGKITLDQILSLINGGLLTGVLVGLRKFIKGLNEVGDDLEKSTFKGALKKTLDDIGNSFKDFAKSFKIVSIAAIAASINLLADALTQLSTIRTEKIMPALGAMTAIIAVMTGMMAGLAALAEVTNKAGKLVFDFDALNKVALAMVALGASMKLMAEAAYMLKDMDPAQIAVIFGSMATAIVALGGSIALMGTAKPERLNAVGTNMIKLGAGFVLMASSLVVLAGAILMIASVKPDDLARSMNAVALGIVLLTTAMGGLGAGAKFGADYSGVGKNILLMATALIPLALAIKILGTMDLDELAKGLGAVAIGLGVLAGAMAGLGYIQGMGGSYGKSAAAIMAFATAMVLLAVPIKVLGGMDLDDLAKGVGALVITLGAFAGAMALFSKFNGQFAGMLMASAAILSFATAAVALTIPIKVLGGMDLNSLAKGLSGFGLALAGMVAAMNLMPNNMSGQAAGMMAFAAGITVLAVAIRLMGSMDLKQLITGLTGFYGVLLGLGFAGTVLGPMAASLMAVAKAMGVFGLACLAIGAGMALAGAGLTALAATGSAAGGILMTALDALIQFIPALAKSLVTALIGVLQVIVAALPQILDALSSILRDLMAWLVQQVPAVAEAVVTMIDKVLQVVAAHADAITDSLVTILIAALNAVAGHAPEITAALGNVMSAIFTAIADSIRNLDPSVLTSLLLSVGVMALIFKALAKMKKDVVGALMVGGTMIGLMAALTGVFALMNLLNPVNTVASAVSLSTALIAMTGAFKIMETAKKNVIGALAVGSAMAAILAELALVFGLMSAMNIDSVGTIAASLSGTILAIAATAAIMSLVNVGAAATGVAALATFIAGLAAIVVAAGAIKQIPGVDWLVSEGAAFMAKIGAALGGFIGSIAGAITGAIMGAIGSSLPELATGLSNFMTNLKPFIAGAKEIDGSVATAVDTLANVVLKLTASSLLDAITSFITGGNGIENFGTKLVPLGQALKDYSVVVDGLNSASIVSSAMAAQALTQVLNALPSDDGLWQRIAGSKDWSTLSDGLVQMGMALSMYGVAVTGLQPGPISASIEALNGLNGVLNAVPSDDGWWQKVAGGKDWSTLSTGLTGMGKALAGYGKAVSGDGVNIDAIQKTVPAIKKLNEVLQNVPSDDGWWQKIAGGKSWGTLTEGLKGLGEALAGYGTAVSGDGVNVGAIQKTVPAVKSLTEILKSDFSQVGDFGPIKNAATQLGNGLSGYYNAVSEVSPDAITPTFAPLRSLINVVNSLGGMKMEGTSVGFITAATQLGIGLSNYTSHVAGLDFSNISASVSAVGSLSKVMGGMPAEYGGVTAFQQAVSTLAATSFMSLARSIQNANSSISTGLSDLNTALSTGTTTLTGSVNALNSAFKGINLSGDLSSQMSAAASAANSGANQIRSALNSLATWLSGFASIWQASFTPIIGATRTGLNLVAQAISSYNGRFSQEGRSLANSLGSGMRSGIGNLSSIFNSALSAAVDGARAYRGSFESAGSYLAAGLAVGISRNSDAVSRAAADAVSNAVEAAKQAGDINSPSRVMAKVGMWFDKGLENGIADNVGGVVRAAKTMMTSSIDVVDSSLSNIGKIDIPEFDVNPTITPVMDLSVVEGQAAYLNSMLSDTVGIGYSSKMIGKITAIPRQRDAGHAVESVEKTPQQIINNYDFTQNNTSPKALSRYDIYKQTRTQFRQFEQMNRNGGR